MTENLKKFLQKISSDEDLRKKLVEINKKYPDVKDNKKEFVKLAKEAGVVLTDADLEDAKAESKEVSLDELSAITGGTFSERSSSGLMGSNCQCIVGGGGSSDPYQKTCACVMGGCGELTDLGKQKVQAGEITFMGFPSAPVAMACLFSGAGGSHGV